MSAQLLEVHLTEKVSQKVDYNWVSVTLPGLQRPIVIVITYKVMIILKMNKKLRGDRRSLNNFPASTTLVTDSEHGDCDMMIVVVSMRIMITVVIVAVMMMKVVVVMISFLVFHILRVAQFLKQPSLLFLRVTNAQGERQASIIKMITNNKNPTTINSTLSR